MSRRQDDDCDDHDDEDGARRLCGVYDQINDGADVDDDRNEHYDYEDDDI